MFSSYVSAKKVRRWVSKSVGGSVGYIHIRASAGLVVNHCAVSMVNRVAPDILPYKLFSLLSTVLELMHRLNKERLDHKKQLMVRLRGKINQLRNANQTFKNLLKIMQEEIVNCDNVLRSKFKISSANSNNIDDLIAFGLTTN